MIESCETETLVPHCSCRKTIPETLLTVAFAYDFLVLPSTVGDSLEQLHGCGLVVLTGRLQTQYLQDGQDAANFQKLAQIPLPERGYKVSLCPEQWQHIEQRGTVATRCEKHC